MTTIQMNKTIEYSFDVGIALLATLLQIHAPGFLQIHAPVFDLYTISLKFAVFGGSMSYVFKAMRDEKLSTKDAVFTAFTGYTFGIFAAPAFTKYYGIDVEPVYSGFSHYFIGGMGMWLMNIGWSIMKGANAEAWPIVKSWLLEIWERVKTWIPKKRDNDDSPTNS